MFAWMIYVVVVTVMLSAAAWLAEQASRRRRTASRWIWISAIVASLLLPSMIASVSIQVPNLFKPAALSAPLALRDETSLRLPAMIAELGTAVATSDTSTHTDVLPRVWIALSVAIAMALAINTGLLHRRKRQWRQSDLLGTSVWVAPDAGPAVVGLFRPRIVVPAWLVESSNAYQHMAMAHEQSHIQARDPQMLAMALGLLLIMPWNLPLWWQLHRLRRAMEVDCDARVLRGGRDINTYCETLIEVGQSQSTHIGAVAAMSESRSFLEQRIKIMLVKPKKWAGVSALALVCLSAGMVTFAAQVSPPNVSAPAPVIVPDHDNAGGGSRPAPVIVSDLKNTSEGVGDYQLAPYSVITVALNGTQLSVQLTGQRPLDVFPTDAGYFAAKSINVRIGFERDNHGQISELVLLQNGRELHAPRISGAAASQIAQALSDRVRNQQPFLSSKKALELILADDDSGQGMSPELAQARARQKSQRENYLAQLGPVVNYHFSGVNSQGWDKYLVRHQQGTEDVAFVLDANGIIVGSMRHP
jgi:beta-lactamase regulating signal transducer with metallopeptidase domain